MKTRWTCSNTSVYNISYHIIWCTKYRRPILDDEVQVKLKELLNAKADELGITIETMEVMTDHVHLFVKASPIYAPHFIVQQFKGCSSYTLRKMFSPLRTKVPTLWTRSYYIESIGHISEKTVKRYIEEQKNI